MPHCHAVLAPDWQRIGVANDNGQSGQLFVDVNEKNIDGSPNPYLGRLFLAQDQPRTTYQPAFKNPNPVLARLEGRGGDGEHPSSR